MLAKHAIGLGYLNYIAHSMLVALHCSKVKVPIYAEFFWR